ncbi:cytochrome c family protein [Hoeflea sp. WL0058]|uniref:Cytochrome c family protein n=1 Tax=Flavimaribacter sediminis TaxID=2865987 RepID=A0AAE2ZM96_9HYPH|nr:cytochrome c family protein [Flavimaribacter sediminis]MBW8638831.1 cytochrome c family protein [Flavimaribacter sediminis]
MFSKFLAAMAVFTISATAPALADGDPAEGAKVFRKCRACHTVDQEKNRVGPHLVGIVGRPVASIDSFKYSGAMTEFGADGKVWDEETLTVYLRKPRALVKKTTMVFAGFKKDGDIENLLAYLSDPSAAE